MQLIHPPMDGTTTEFEFGMELIIDIRGCDLEVITNSDELRRYIDDLVELLGMKKFGELWLHHFGHASSITTGYTVFQAIETSSIVVHASEGLRSVHANIFSCQKFDAGAARDYSEMFFRGVNTTYSVLPR